MLRGLISIIFLGLFQFLIGQSIVEGQVVDTDANPLPYATIYEKGTSNGTTTNDLGRFELKLSSAEATIIVQYVGYENTEVKVDAQSNREVRIQLEAATYKLEEVTIAADAEDPAYRVVRAAIDKREDHLMQFDAYSCKVYIKGFQKILEAPEKILGQEIGDFDGALDSNRTGIVYLSESLANYYYKAPDKRKEVMISSKLSGNDRGYSFNTASEMEANFYKNSLSFNREIVSPIADNALFYYEYKLEGTYYDQQGNLINKIQVIPKRDNDPVFSGTIYIIEDKWNIHSLQLNLSKNATHIYFIDNLNFNQIHVPIQGNDAWAMMTNSIEFDLNAMGLKLEGIFTAVYSDYDIESEIDDAIFDNAILKVEAGANKKDDAYWEEVRPVPLTEIESQDYHRRDSISTVRESPAYLDSIDRKGNKFQATDLITGYRYRRQKDLFSFDVDSPLEKLQFNPVHGYNTRMGAQIVKYYDKEKTRRLIVWPTVSYGFSDKRWRYDLKTEYRFDRLKRTRLGVHGGNQDFQYSIDHPVSESWNSFYALLLKDNYVRLFNKKFGKIYGQQELTNGIFLKASVEYAQRNLLRNTSESSYFKKDEVYDFNYPYLSLIDDLGYPETSDALTLDVDLEWTPGQQYFEYPDRKFIAGSKYPRFTLHFTKALRGIAGNAQFNHLGATIAKAYQLGIHGYFQFHLNGGFFFDSERIWDNDRKFFPGNRFHVGSTWSYPSRFLRLHPYAISSSDSYYQMHVQHDFEGWVLDKIPAINKLGWSFVTGAKYLSGDGQRYYEIHGGVDNMGFGIFRLLRFDVIWSKHAGHSGELGFLFGVKI